MTREELNLITKWLEINANASKFRNVYEMLERFKLEFNHLLKEEQHLIVAYGQLSNALLSTTNSLFVHHSLRTI